MVRIKKAVAVEQATANGARPDNDSKANNFDTHTHHTITMKTLIAPLSNKTTDNNTGALALTE